VNRLTLNTLICGGRRHVIFTGRVYDLYKNRLDNDRKVLALLHLENTSHLSPECSLYVFTWKHIIILTFLHWGNTLII